MFNGGKDGSDTQSILGDGNPRVGFLFWRQASCFSPPEQVVQLGKLISIHAYRRSLVSRNHEYTNVSKEGSLNTSRYLSSRLF